MSLSGMTSIQSEKKNISQTQCTALYQNIEPIPHNYNLSLFQSTYVEYRRIIDILENEPVQHVTLTSTSNYDVLKQIPDHEWEPEPIDNGNENTEQFLLLEDF